MSTPDPDPNQEYARDPSAPRARLLLLIRALAGALALTSLVSLWFSERARVRDDLQLSSEVTARPGETIALRAFYLKDVEAPEGPALVTAPTTVKLLDAHDRELLRVELKPAHGDTSMEGSLRLPATVRGGFALQARAALPGRAPLTCRRGLLVAESAPTLVPRPREAPPLQQQALGSVRGAATPGVALLPRVLGGACAPEQRCAMLVWLGAESARLRLQPDAAWEDVVIEPSGVTQGLVRVSFVVHGPEANATLVAESADGKLLGERTLRLPVALGEAKIELGRSLYLAGESIPVQVQLPPGRGAGILDLFAEGRWRSTQAFRAADHLELAGASLPAGLLRLQAHTDRFAGEGAGARLLLVRDRALTQEAAIAPIASALRAAGVETAPWDERTAALPPGVAPDLAATFMLAGLEQRRVPLPRASSARPFELQRLSRAQSLLRFGIGGLLALSALAVGLSLMRRGLSAQREAEGILAEGAEQSGEGGNKPVIPGVFFVVFLVLAVGLAFLVAALLIIAKPLWF